MAIQVSLKKNFIMNMLLTASSMIFPLITYPYVSRVLLPEGMGRVAFVTSVVSYFSMVSSLPPMGSAHVHKSVTARKN